MAAPTLCYVPLPKEARTTSGARACRMISAADEPKSAAMARGQPPSEEKAAEAIVAFLRKTLAP